MDRVLHGVFEIRTDRGVGTGFVVQVSTGQHYILTSARVVAGAEVAKVVLLDNSAPTVKIVARDEDRDLALLEVPESANLPVLLSLGNSDNLRVGDPLYVVGFPLATSQSGAPSESDGVFSAWRTVSSTRFIQTSAAINPGNSGGPVMDQHGQVVGVAVVELGGAQGMNYAIPSSLVRSEVERLASLVVSKRVEPGDTWKPISMRIPLGNTKHFTGVGVQLFAFGETSWDQNAVWIGQQMFVWGNGGGALYDPDIDKWAPVSLKGAPTQSRPAMVWTGTEVITWDGADGGRYDPATNSWKSLPKGGPHLLSDQAVWTGHEMIVDEMAYNPTTNTWRALPSDGAPSIRDDAAEVWTGKEVIVWGGMDASMYAVKYGTRSLGDGARYNPTTNRWSPLSSDNAPAPRGRPLAVWTGHEMLVLGGLVGSVPTMVYYPNGGRYDPASDTWRAIPATNLLPPSAYCIHETAIWTGRQVIIWGGYWEARNFCNQYGGMERPIQARYDPQSDLWSPLPATGAPSGLFTHAAVWTGKEMIVLGSAKIDSKNLYELKYVFRGARYVPPGF